MNDFQEYFDMLMVLGKCRKYYRNAQDFCAVRDLDRQQKSHMAFKRLPDRFCRFGTVKQTRVKHRPIVNENNAAAILAFAALNTHASSIICIIGQMRIFDGLELYHFNICGPLIVGATLSAITSLVHIF